MARIVLGLGTSHSPMLSTPPDLWPLHVQRDSQNAALLAADGEYHTYDELLAGADPRIAAEELRPEKWQARHDTCQAAIATLGRRLAEVAPDVVVVVGDDQQERFHDDNMPAMSVYWGDHVTSTPFSAEHFATMHESLRAAYWGYYGDQPAEYPCHSALGRHLIEQLIAADFDVAHSREQPPGVNIGHAVAFVQRRIMNGRAIPLVPVSLNTYYPPNQPRATRCYALGQALRRAIEAWPGDERVAVVASGGLSHFVVLEEFDRAVLAALAAHDEAAIARLPERLFQTGTSETKNWLTVGGAAEHLQMEVVAYVPNYRSPAGTGVGMAFAQWT
jgi:aromatic ring-opening dioxygenase catalytic subunit (LigB family)